MISSIFNFHENHANFGVELLNAPPNANPQYSLKIKKENFYSDWFFSFEQSTNESFRFPEEYGDYLCKVLRGVIEVMQRIDSNELIKVSTAGIFRTVFPSNYKKFSSYQRFLSGRLEEKLTFITTVHLIFNSQSLHSKEAFSIILNDVKWEIIKRTLNLNGLISVSNSFNFSEALFNNINCGFDFSVGYVFLLQSNEFIFVDQADHHTIIEGSLIDFISIIRNEGKLGAPINWTLVEVFQMTNVEQIYQLFTQEELNESSEKLKSSRLNHSPMVKEITEEEF
jgi:hypothetical protein